MVKSLDELIGYLLDEIALSGEQGATIAEIFSYIEAFYNDDANAATEAPTIDAHDRSVHRHTVDRAFQEKVWKWLAGHPDVYVDRNEKGNELTFSEAEALSSPISIENQAHYGLSDSQQKRSSGYVDRAPSVQAENTLTPAVEGKDTSTGTLPVGDQRDSATAPARAIVDDLVSATSQSQDSKTLRVHVSEERMWHAVAGHAPDFSRMQRLDFMLLSIVAAHRENGILQPDLTRISGQDKRSTPVRTQRLHDKGYIEKKKVQTKGQATSLCTLRKFVASTSKTASDPTGVTDEVIRRDTSVTKAGAQEELIDVKAMLRRMFDILNEMNIVTHLDLKRKLGFLGRRWPMRILSRTIRKLEIMGCVRRVKARSQYGRHDRYFHRCVKLIREPENDEWQLFWDPMRGLPAHMRANGDVDGAIADLERDEEDEEEEEAMDDNTNRGTQEPEGDSLTAGLQEIGRPVPQWTPDQSLNNFLLDLVSMSGTRGLSTMDIKAFGVGNFYRRPVEHQLSRLVDAWQLSQPLELRHLAIVRDTAISKTIAHYVHYSYESFEKLVNSGQSSWDAVEIVRKDSKAKKVKIEIAPIGIEPELDEFGFAGVQTSCFLGGAGNATIVESVLAAKLEPFYIGRLDPVAVKLEDGTYGIKFRSDLGYNSMDIPMPLSSPRRPRKKGEQTPDKPFRTMGRPRKYPKGEEPYYSANSQKMKKWKISLARARRYETMKKVRASGLQLGVEKVATRDTPSINGALLMTDVNQEMQSAREPDVIKSQRPSKRSATDAELNEETPEENYFATTEVTMSATPHNERIGAAEKHQEDAPRSGEEILDADTIRVRTPGDSFAVSSLPTVAPHAKDLQARPRRPPRKKTKKAVEVVARNSQPQTNLAVLASAEIGLTYDQQAQLLGARTTTGVYIGQRVSRKGGRGRPPKSRLLIARSSRLKEFTWFVEDHPTNTATSMELVSDPVPSVQSSSPNHSAHIPSVTHTHTTSAPVLNTSDDSSTTNTATAPVGTPEVVSTYISKVGKKRKRKPSIPGSAMLTSSINDPVSHIAAQSESNFQPARKRRGVTKVSKDSSLVSGPVQELSSQDTSVHIDALSDAPSQDADNDAIQLLNDVMNVVQLKPSSINADAFMRADLPVLWDGIVRTTTSSMIKQQDQILSEVNLETIQSVRTLPETPAQILWPEDSSKDLAQPKALDKVTQHDQIEDGSGGDNSLDTSFAAVGQVRDASASEGDNTIETQSFSAAHSVPIKPTDLQSPSSLAEPEQTNGASEPQVDGEELSLQQGTQQLSAVSVSLIEPDTTSSPGKQVADPPSPTIENSIQGPGRKKTRTSYPSRSMIAMGGGSVGAQRRKIIMEIIERCGGLFPGERELWYPFASAWMKTPDAGKPDQRTIKMTTKALVDSGKLRQLKFSFRDKKGIMLTKTILTTPHISPTSPAIKELERKIIEEDPNPYIPPDADVTPEIRKANQRSFSKLASSKNLAVEKDDKVQLQYVPAYVRHAEMNKKMALERRRIRQEALMGKSFTEGKSQRGHDPTFNSLLGQVELLEKANRPARVQRLARLQRPFGFRPQVLPSPLPTFAVSPPLNEDIGPTSDLELPRDDPIFSIRQTPRVMSSESAFPRKHGLDYEALDSGRRRYTSQGLLVRPKEPMVSGLGPRFSNSKSESSSFGTLNAQPSQSWLRRSRDSSYKKHAVTLLKPKIVFHPSTGTFATEYLTVRKYRKHNRAESAWDQVRGVALPHRLEDIILHPNLSPEPDHTNADDPAKSKFDWAVDAVQEWELEYAYALSERSNDLHFINHSLGKDHESIQYDPVEELFEAQEWEPGMTAKDMRDNYFRHTKRSQIGPDNREHTSLEIIAPTSAKRPSLVPKLKTRRLTCILENNTAGIKGASDVDSAAPDPTRTVEPRKLRGPQISRYIPLATVHRIMTAVVVIRTITGGLERNVDWVLVAQLFEDRYDPSFVQSRWSTILQRNRLHVQRLQANFQDIFIEAYENNMVPQIDYDNLQDYDWAWLVDWAQKQLDIPDTRALPSLPSTREQLDDLYDLRSEKEPEVEALFDFNRGAPLLKRINVITAAPFTVPLQSREPKIRDAHKERLSIAKSWVRANVITPEEVYNSEEARRKLLTVGEDTIESALRELISDKILQQENRGRLIPGRNYDISASFLSNLKMNLEVTHFHQAVAYKFSLDRSFAEHGMATHSYHASDGDALALTNLLAHHRVTIHARNPPREKFGLTDGGYKTRFMDKSRLHFDVGIRPSPTYLYGNPLLPLPPPPQHHLAHPHLSLDARIPAWFDIHGNLVPVMWEVALAACLAALALRPGMSAWELAKAFRGSLEAWEVEQVLEWMVGAGAATRAGREGYVVGEWWWACLWMA